MIPRILVSIVFVFVFCSAFTQLQGIKSIDQNISTADSQKIFISVKGSSFFKNNEYFNPIDEGYTLIGYYAEPTLKLQLTGDFSIEAGVGFQKYSGRDGFYHIEPVFRAHYQPVSYFHMVLGNLYGGSMHGLVEPLYRWERDFTNPHESGVQFLFNTGKVKADIWLNWEKFIMHGDPFQEELTVGISTESFLTSKEGDFQLSIPAQILFRHQGGQILSLDTSLVTLSNWALGFNILKKFKGSFFKYIQGEAYYIGFSDFSPKKQQQFLNGYAIYPKVKAGFGNFSTEIGYFHGSKFISPMGEKLFHSGTIPAIELSYPTKNLFTSKIWFTKNISSGIALSTYFEAYSDLSNGMTDYCYGVHISFNQVFFLLKY
jgi:hypothetical protein